MASVRARKESRREKSGNAREDAPRAGGAGLLRERLPQQLGRFDHVRRTVVGDGDRPRHDGEEAGAWTPERAAELRRRSRDEAREVLASPLGWARGYDRAAREGPPRVYRRRSVSRMGVHLTLSYEEKRPGKTARELLKDFHETCMHETRKLAQKTRQAGRSAACGC